MFSVIVPIYKVEKYLCGSINSVLAQNFTDFEMILVNDGSPDNCPQICDEYAVKDSRVFVIHQENGGASIARNAGLLVAKGDYIVFLDADDEMQPFALHNLAEKLKEHKNPDLLIVNFSHWYGDKEVVIESNQRYLEQEYFNIWELCQDYISHNAQLPWRPYQIVINRKLLRDSKVLFDENYTVGEDCDFFLRLIEKINNFEVCNVNLVKYRAYRSDSLVNTHDFRKIYSQLTVFAKYTEYYNTCFGNGYLMRRYFADNFANIIVLVEFLTQKQDKEVCYKFIRENRNIIRYTSKRPKYLFARLVWAGLGYRRGSDLLNIINNIRKKHKCSTKPKIG